MALMLQLKFDLQPPSGDLFGRLRRGKKARQRLCQFRSQVGSAFSGGNIELSSIHDVRDSLSDHGGRVSRFSTASPGFSSRLRIKRRDVNVNSNLGDRLMQLAEWVYAKVKDPMVEIDPVTVEKKMRAEQEDAKRRKIVEEYDETAHDSQSEETIATVGPFTLPYNRISTVPLSTKVAGIALILVALCLAYIGFLMKSSPVDKSKKSSSSFPVSPAQTGSGGKTQTVTLRPIPHSSQREETFSPPMVYGQFQTSSGGSSDSSLSVPAPVVLTSKQDQVNLILEPAASVPETTTLPASVGAEEPVVEGLESEWSSETGISLDKPLKESVAFVDQDLKNAPDEVKAPFPKARPLNEVLAYDGSESDKSSEDLTVSRTDAEPEEGYGRDRSSEVKLGSKAIENQNASNLGKPFEDVVEMSGLGHPEGVSETEAVEIQNALLLDEAPEQGLTSFEEFLEPKVEEESALPAFNTEEVQYFDERKGPRSEITLETALNQLEINDEDVAVETSSSQVVEHPQLVSVDDDTVGEPTRDAVSVGEALNGSAASTLQKQYEEERRASNAEAIQAIVPAIVVGAGAASILSGVNSSFEVVGLVATASFLAQEVVLATTRHQLFKDLEKVKDHNSFLEFLKTRQIIK